MFLTPLLLLHVQFPITVDALTLLGQIITVHLKFKITAVALTLIGPPISCIYSVSYEHIFSFRFEIIFGILGHFLHIYAHFLHTFNILFTRF